MIGYIYIIKVRESIRLEEQVYKVGRTKNVIKRLRQYPKGSVLLYTVFTDNIIEIEKELLSKLSSFVARRFGTEYIQCSLDHIKKTIDDLAKITDVPVEEEENPPNFNETEDKYPNSLNDDDSEKQKVKPLRKEELIEIRTSIGKFYEDKILKDTIKEYKLYDIHREFNEWTNNAYSINVHLLGKMLRDLGGKTLVKRFDDEATKIVTFETAYEAVDAQDRVTDTINTWLHENYNITLKFKENRVLVRTLLDDFKSRTNSSCSASVFKERLESMGLKYLNSSSNRYYCGLTHKNLQEANV
jgi:hypothetical protein